MELWVVAVFRISGTFLYCKICRFETLDYMVCLDHRVLSLAEPKLLSSDTSPVPNAKHDHRVSRTEYMFKGIFEYIHLSVFDLFASHSCLTKYTPRIRHPSGRLSTSYPSFRRPLFTFSSWMHLLIYSLQYVLY